MHTKQVIEFVRILKSDILAFNVKKHLLICRSAKKESISLKLSHEIDFREYIETFNILSFVETSKGKLAQYLVSDILNKYDLLLFSDRVEACVMLDRFSLEIKKVDTYRVISYND